jgi:hypothetical protein
VKLAAAAGLVVVAGCASAVPAARPVSAGSGTVLETAEIASSDAAAAVAMLATAAPRPQASDAPEVHVTAPREGASPRHEDRLIGDYGQPEWTTERRFATTRAYVLPEGQIEFEQWLKMHAPRGERPDHLWQTEIGIGLPGRWQFDLYENYGDTKDPKRFRLKHQTVQLEARYALADWGCLPLNPTLYLEYKINHRAADVLEGKVLLADDLGGGWHWAGNLFAEQQLGDEREVELGAATGISYALLDSRFSVGAEAKYERVTARHGRDDPENELLVGPSFQWRPTDNTHLDLVTLAGLTKSDRRDPRYEVYVVFGIDFGPEREGARAPTSSRSR